MEAKQRKKLARTLYIELDMSQQEICEQLDLDKGQMSRWVNNEGWKEIKLTRSTTPTVTIQRHMAQIDKIHDLAEEEGRALTAAESDQIYKLTLSIKELDKSADLGAYTVAYKELCDYVRQFDEDFAKQLVDVQLEYLTIKAKQILNG